MTNPLRKNIDCQHAAETKGNLKAKGLLTSRRRRTTPVVTPRSLLLKQAATQLMEADDEGAIATCVKLGVAEIEDHLYALRRQGETRPKTFGDLHDTCDANEFGGLCEDCIFELLEARANDFLCDFGNAVQNRLNAMLPQIKARKHKFV